MGLNLICSGQRLAAFALILGIGLSSYGCADSASVNPVVELASLTVAPGTLQPAFNSATTQYNIDLTSNISTVTVTAQAAVAGDTVTINGQATTSLVITLGAAGTTTSVNIVVSESSSNSRTYTVLINRADPGGNNSLKDVTVSSTGGSLTLAPRFDANTLRYIVNVGSSVFSVTVKPTLQDLAATMEVNRLPAASDQDQPITLKDPGSSTPIDIVVFAQNNRSKTYSVDVVRAPLGGDDNLQRLTVSPGKLNPEFTPSRPSFTVNVGSNDDTMTVTAIPEDPSARVTINGLATNPHSIPLPVGRSEIDVLVIAPNGNDQTYLITVFRPAPTAPPAPTVAPDLIQADDSCARDTVTNECLPGTSDEDNITNVTTPRFRIAQPAVEEIPNLYVAIGFNPIEKVQSSFDPATNIITLTNPLPPGVYDITVTSTVTNAAGESPQSPSLTVTIDTVAP